MNDIDTTFIDTPRDSRERTSLHLVSTGTRVRTEVMRRTAERITVTQALPFLKLKSGVRDADGRAASIEWVSVDIEGDTPALVMELVYEEPSREDATERTRAAAADGNTRHPRRAGSSTRSARPHRAPGRPRNRRTGAGPSTCSAR